MSTEAALESDAKRARLGEPGDHAAAASATSPSIALSETEERIFSLLLDVCKHFNFRTTMRVAGGWVRDRVLGSPSDDIDIALDDMMGADFAARVNEYLTLRGEATHTVGVIKANPEQSKHLEVATFTVFGVSIDVNNLRVEVYDDATRIPTMQFGTAEEDALRRDLTINSLFYNINTRRVEDLTGRGLDDLRARVVRTPLEPLRTFRDDPLRVLRSLRFAARYQYTLADDLQIAACDVRIRTALRNKVSRERYRLELDKVLKGGGDPVFAFELVCRFGLYPILFSLPSWHADVEACIPDVSAAPPPDAPPLADADAAVAAVVHAQPSADGLTGASVFAPFGFVDLAARPDAHEVYRTSLTAMREALRITDAVAAAGGGNAQYSLEDRRTVLMAAFLHPLHGFVVPGAKPAHTAPLVEWVTLEMLKYAKKDAHALLAVLNGAHACLELVRDAEWIESIGGAEAGGSGAAAAAASVASAPAASERLLVHVGERLVRTAGALWPLAVDLASALDASRGAEHLQRYSHVRAWVERASLADAWNWKPLVGGDVISRTLNVRGPGIAAVVAECTRWRCAHPRATADDCLVWLREKAAAAAAAAAP